MTIQVDVRLVDIVCVQAPGGATMIKGAIYATEFGRDRTEVQKEALFTPSAPVRLAVGTPLPVNSAEKRFVLASRLGEPGGELLGLGGTLDIGPSAI